LTHKLLEKREENPDMPIVLITDPINTGYYSYESKHIKALEANNIEVIITDLDKLHDSNKPYKSIWRMLAKPFGHGKTGWLDHACASNSSKTYLRSYLTL